MLSKKERFFAALEQCPVLCCPVCGGALTAMGDSLRCGRGHTLNVHRKGCLNVLSKQSEGCYDAALFAARARVFASGCYAQVVDAIADMLPEKPLTMIDAGCGEGWWLNSLLQRRAGSTGIGIDISRDAIFQATDWECPAMWIVGDVRRLPVLDGSADVLLDVLTPAAYAEFARVLKPDGLCIKVYPGSAYLREIRAARGMEQYAEGQVDAYLRERAEVVKSTRVTVTVPADAALWEAFVRMTPLNQDLTDAEKDALAAAPAETVTVDLWVTAVRLEKKDG